MHWIAMLMRSKEMALLRLGKNVNFHAAHADYSTVKPSVQEISSSPQTQFHAEAAHPVRSLAKMTADMATITSTTTYTAKPDVSFKGYYLNADGGLTSTTCQNDLPTFIARGNVVDCCASAPGCVFPEPCTACAYPTACSNNAEVYDFSVSGTAHTWPCRALTCKTLMIYESYPHSTKGWSKTAHWCVGDSDPTVLFRNYESTLDMTITGITKPTSSPTSVPASTTASMPQDTGSSDSSSGGKSESKAGPIAGGVVGGVAAVAIVIAALFFIMKRQKKKNLELQAVNEIGTEYVAAGK